MLSLGLMVGLKVFRLQRITQWLKVFRVLPVRGLEMGGGGGETRDGEADILIVW